MDPHSPKLTKVGIHFFAPAPTNRSKIALVNVPLSQVRIDQFAGRLPELFQALDQARAQHQSLTAMAAKAVPDQPLADALKLLAMQTVVARLYAAGPDLYVIKGSTGLHGRLLNARFPKDLDIDVLPARTAWTTPAGAKVLQHTLNHIQGANPATDPFYLTETRTPVLSPRTAKVTFTIASTYQVFATLSIDLARPRSRAARHVAFTPTNTVPGVGVQHPTTVLGSGFEDELAAKLAGMYTRHGTNNQPSSRYKDLVDAVLICTDPNIKLDPGVLRESITRATCGSNVHIPKPLRSPGPAWAQQYPSLAKQWGLPSEHRNLHCALALVNTTVHPDPRRKAPAAVSDKVREDLRRTMTLHGKPATAITTTPTTPRPKPAIPHRTQPDRGIER